MPSIRFTCSRCHWPLLAKIDQQTQEVRLYDAQDARRRVYACPQCRREFPRRITADEFLGQVWG